MKTCERPPGSSGHKNSCSVVVCQHLLWQSADYEYTDAWFVILSDSSLTSDKVEAARTLLLRPKRVPGTVPFGCPAPCLSLDLTSLSRALLCGAALLAGRVSPFYGRRVNKFILGPN